MDLSSLDVVKGANQGFELELLHPTQGTPLGARITVLGRDSDEFRRILNDQNRRRLDKVSKGQAISPDEVTNNTVELLAGVTRSWRRELPEGGFAPTLLENGEEIPFTVANAATLYRKYPWMKEQVDVAVSSRENFIKGS